MSKGFVIYLDPISGETLRWPEWSAASPNLTRGPYIDENGQSFYICMSRIWPQDDETNYEERENE